MFTLICALINGWVNNREAGDLRHYRAHYDVIVMLPNLLFARLPRTCTLIYSSLRYIFCSLNSSMPSIYALVRYTIIVSDGCLLYILRQAMVRIIAKPLSVGSMRTTFNAIWVKIRKYPKILPNMPSAAWIYYACNPKIINYLGLWSAWVSDADAYNTIWLIRIFLALKHIYDDKSKIIIFTR